MNDIVKALRDEYRSFMAGVADPESLGDVILGAVDEIERLRAVVRVAADDTCSGPAAGTCRAEWPDADDRWCASCLARSALAGGWEKT